MPIKVILFIFISFMLFGCTKKTTEQLESNTPKFDTPKFDVSGNGNAMVVEKTRSETPSNEIPSNDFNTYSNIVKCIESLGVVKKEKLKENLRNLEKELSPIVEHAKPISLSFMIVNGEVPEKCLNNRLVDENR
jgi:glucan phosphoethanolaminetransferase (alkaline phosphatase superfamily)